MKLGFTLVTLLFINGCTEKNYDVLQLDSSKKDIQLILSHNINGETHPCGCRHFPLGGMQNVGGEINALKKNSHILYLDTGDALFPSTKVPKGIKRSLTYTAKKVAEGMVKLGLNYKVPGDQDLANGVGFYRNLINKYKIKLIASNIVKEDKLPHKKWVKVVHQKNKLFFTGVVNPELYLLHHRYLFGDPKTMLEKTLSTIVKEGGYDAKNPQHRLILLSHGGIQFDTQIAKKFPQFNWILGSHNQKYTTEPVLEKKTKIVQVLSRNHYIGKISIGPSEKKDKWSIVEVEEFSYKKLTPNPFIKFLEDHKKRLSAIQIKEQEVFDKNLADSKIPVERMSTYIQCAECHTKQTNFWRSTDHSLAYTTLVKAGQPNDLKCIKCHSVGLGNKKGFNRQRDLVHIEAERIRLPEAVSDGKSRKELARLKFDFIPEQKEKYFRDIDNAFKDVKAVREMDDARVLEMSKMLGSFDFQHHVDHNYSNVQCLNCHTQHEEHPFSNMDQNQNLDKKKRMADIQSKCLQCHDSEQSPAWYKEGKPNQEVISKMVAKIACPLRE